MLGADAEAAGAGAASKPNRSTAAGAAAALDPDPAGEAQSSAPQSSAAGGAGGARVGAGWAKSLPQSSSKPPPDAAAGCGAGLPKRSTSGAAAAAFFTFFGVIFFFVFFFFFFFAAATVDVVVVVVVVTPQSSSSSHIASAAALARCVAPVERGSPSLESLEVSNAVLLRAAFRPPELELAALLRCCCGCRAGDGLRPFMRAFKLRAEVRSRDIASLSRTKSISFFDFCRIGSPTSSLSALRYEKPFKALMRPTRSRMSSMQRSGPLLIMASISISPFITRWWYFGGAWSATHAASRTRWYKWPCIAASASLLSRLLFGK